MRRKLWLEQLTDFFTQLDPGMRYLPPPEQLDRTAKMYVRASLHGAVTPIDRDTCATVGMFLRDYRNGRAHVFKIAERFGSHLSRTRLNVPTDALNLEFATSYCVEFPDGIVFHGSRGESWRTAIVNVGAHVPTGENAHTYEILLKEQLPAGWKPQLGIAFPDYDANGNITEAQSFMSFPLNEPTLDECVDALERRVGRDLVISKEAVNYLMKCLLYIKSGEPDLTHEAGYYTPTKKPKKLRQQQENFCRFDTVNVGYGFHERLYHVDATSVVGHFRWQPYGPERGMVRLIWIDEHARHFNRTKEKPAPTT